MSSISRQIKAIAFPAIISNITTPLLAMIDIAIVGHFGAASYIGAIAIGSGMFNMLYWLFGFLRMGSSGITAQAYGAGDRRAADTQLFRSLAIAFIAGLAILSCSSMIASAMLPFMDADAATAPIARRYFMIAVTGAPATLATFALSGWFLGMQDSRTPMWTALVTNIVNIVASLILVYGLDMRIEGVAIGSSVAQWSGFVFGLSYAMVHYRPRLHRFAQLFDFKEIKRFFSVNTDIFLRTVCLVAVTLWFTRAGASQGVDILAANALLLQLFMFFSYFMDGFAFAGEALAGKFHGAGDEPSLKSVIKSLTGIGIILAVTFSLVYFVAGNSILALLTDDSDVLAVCARYRWWAVAVPLAGTMAFVWDGILIGLTRTRIMLTAMLISSALFFIIYFATIHTLANHGLWLSFIIYLAARGIFERLLFHYRRHIAVNNC